MAQHYNYISSKNAQQGNFELANEQRYAVQNMMQRNVQNDGDNQNINNFSGFTYQMNSTGETESDFSNNTYYNMRNAKTNKKYFSRKK